MKHCCERHADSKACDCRPCHRCDGLGWYNEMGPNTFPVRCQTCDGISKLPTPDDSLPPPVSWSDWLAGCEGVVMPVVVLTGEPVLRWYAQGDSTVYGLRNGGRCVRYHDKGRSPEESRIIAELLALEWPGVEFRWPGRAG